MVYYLPSTQVHTATDPEPEAIYTAAQRAVLRHDRWCDKAHLLGKAAQRLHPNHAAFVKELKNEIEELEATKSLKPAFAPQFIESSFKDVLDAVRHISPDSSNESYIITLQACLPRSSGWRLFFPCSNSRFPFHGPKENESRLLYSPPRDGKSQPSTISPENA
jgi:hypothetical protein